MEWTEGERQAAQVDMVDLCITTRLKLSRARDAVVIIIRDNLTLLFIKTDKKDDNQ